MPVVLPPAARQAIERVSLEEALLVLLTVDYLGVVYRFVNNNENVVSRGQTYLAYPFELALPSDTEDQLSEASIRIDNVSGEILDTFRTFETSPNITLEIIRTSVPDEVLLQTIGFRLRAISVDEASVEGKILLDDVYRFQYPMHDYLPSTFPGLFP